MSMTATTSVHDELREIKSYMQELNKQANMAMRQGMTSACISARKKVIALADRYQLLKSFTNESIHS